MTAPPVPSVARGSRWAHPWRYRDSPLQAFGVLVSAAAGGLLVAAKPVAVVAVLALVLLALAFIFPRVAVAGIVVAAGAHGGIYLHYRFEVNDIPIGIFDAVPLLLLVAAVSLGRAGPKRPSLLLLGALALLVLGAVIGTVYGFAEGTADYQVLRALRYQGALILVLIAAALAGHSRQWANTVARGIYALGLVVAVQLLISYVWLVTTGGSLWSNFPFGGATTDFSSSVSSGALNNLRDNAISPFLMLPATALAAFRLTRRDGLALTLMLVASLISLSRTFWAATLLVLLVVAFARIATDRAQARRFLALGAVVLLAAGATTLVAGDVVEERLRQAIEADDASTRFRLAETSTALDQLSDNTGSLVFGLGAGTIVEHPELAAVSRETVSSLYENKWLSYWLNSTALAVAGVVILLLGGTRSAWRQLRASAHVDEVAAMALSLPAFAVFAAVGAPIDSYVVTIPIWLLAATVLTRSAKDQPNIE